MSHNHRSSRLSKSGNPLSGVCRREFIKRTSLLAGGFPWLLGSLGHAAKNDAESLPSPVPPRVLPQPVPLADQQPGGEMLVRLRRNMQRLESEIYDPEHVFQTTDNGNGWPGDTEGRLVLGVTLEAQALPQEPKHLEEILRRFPAKFNARGLFGAARPPEFFDEQLLSSHGWVLRGLSEYYLWTGDHRMTDWANRMLDSLAVPLAGKILATYPLDPASRKHGKAESGFVNQEINGWRLSSDTGCLFIFFDGLVQASLLLGRKDMVPIMEELKELMLRADLATIKAQTHASLTGLRALCRLYEQNPDASLLRAIQNRWALYRNTAMTANGENYNWFGRPEWTEPCAVVDSLLVAVHLWRFTRDPSYLEDAHLIYYNGLAAEQRANGGFGLNTCAHADDPVLRMHAPEATWCCTMRGGEGLARAAQFTFFTDADGVVVAFPRTGEATMRQGGEFITLKQSTGYPHQGGSRIEVLDISPRFAGKLKFFSPGWMTASRIALNGRVIIPGKEAGFLVLAEPLQRGDRVDWSFEQPLRLVSSERGRAAVYQGPLLLGVKGGLLPVSLSLNSLRPTGSDGLLEVEGKTFAPVYHLMDPAAEQAAYGCQVLFLSSEHKMHGA